MKLRQIILILFALVLIGVLGAETIWVINSQSRTLSRIDTDNAQAENSFAVLGNSPNKLAIGEDALWVVNSGDNSIQKIDSTSGQTLANYLVEVGSNPWDMVIHEGFGYISGLFTGKIYKMDLGTGEIVASIYAGVSPEGMTIYNNKLYAVCSGDYMLDYAGSALVVIELDSFSVLHDIELPANPQYVVAFEGNIHVSCTGDWAAMGGKIVILNEDAEIIATLDLGGTPGNIWFDNEGVAFVADSSGAAMYSYYFDGFEAEALSAPAFSASDICGSEQFMALLLPNWGDNGNVELYEPDLSFLRSYTVGMMPTDIKIDGGQVSINDEIAPAAIFGVYPNPVNQGGMLKLEGEIFGETTVSIFNLRGQLVRKNMLRQNDRVLDISGLNSGIYFYQVNDGKSRASGKFIVIKS
ncbi:MAG: T9SS type A sorting domain-containing protein [Candidatus Cloacimonadaceae bacterium]